MVVSECANLDESEVFFIEKMTHHLNVHFGEKTYNILKKFASSHDMPMAYVVRLAVTNYFSRKGLYTK